VPLAASDRRLVAAASDAIRAAYVPDWQHIGAALRTASGRVFEGVNLDAYVGRCAVCAEAVVLGAAYASGERAFDAIVAVRWVGRGEPVVVTPCGICRELLSDYGDPYVIHADARGRLVRTRASALLPERYARKGEVRPSLAAREASARRLRARLPRR
jgi:cytidine deaminase